MSFKKNWLLPAPVIISSLHIFQFKGLIAPPDLPCFQIFLRHIIIDIIVNQAVNEVWCLTKNWLGESGETIKVSKLFNDLSLCCNEKYLEDLSEMTC